MVQIELENRSDKPTYLHVHGLSKPVSQDGIPDIEPTPSIKPGESDIEFMSTNPGTFPINGTKTFHQTNNGKTPGGMITKLIYNQ